MPAPAARSSFVIPGRFHPGWSLLGQGLRHLTADRLRAETLHLVLLAGASLAWLLGLYAAEALSALLTAPGLRFGIGAGALLLPLVGIIGFRPPAVIQCESQALSITRGRECWRLPYRTLDRTDVVTPRCYHRHYRHFAAVRPFLNTGRRPILLLHTSTGPIAALELHEPQRNRLLRCIENSCRPTPTTLLKTSP